MARTVSDIGEFGLIAALRAALPPAVTASDALLLGIGDDAAVWQPRPGERIVITTDSLTEGIHFRLDWTDWSSLGHKALAVNLSDLAAMGAAPALATVSLGPRGTELVADLESLYTGLGALAARWGVVVAAGDIVASPHALVIHITALGETRGGQTLTRSGAAAGDMIAVSGSLGASAAGLKLLTENDLAKRNATTASLLIAAHLRPEPRLALGAALLATGASAAMDLSDGLLGDLPKLLAASQVAGTIDATRIPVPAAVRALYPESWLDLATRGGEDYELLFTIAPKRWPTLVTAAANLDATVTAIGEVYPLDGAIAPLTVRDAAGIDHPVEPGGWDHFRKT
ncbi:MAG: thiamine-phosphate kinase [Chloroflexota bacterium]|nr:thiamine-phosphate kinase [Chloroflexota bacterium]